MKWKLFLLFWCLCYSATSAEWVRIKALGRNEGDSLGDIYSQCDQSTINTYKDPDLVTSGHECTHSVNSRIRNQFNSPNGVYMLMGDAFLIGKSPVRLSELARAVPQDKRGQVYNLYLISQQQWWEDDALYILDEMTAYINGSIVGLEKNLEFRSLDSYNRACEMFEYAKVLQELCRKANFKEQKELDNFLDRVYKKRIVYLNNEYKERNWKWQH